MLDLIGRGYRTCDGVTRRSFLRIGSLGIGGLALPNLLRRRAQAAAVWPGQVEVAAPGLVIDL